MKNKINIILLVLSNFFLLILLGFNLYTYFISTNFIYNRSLKSIVEVKCNTKEFISFGTAVFFSKNELITNYHVVSYINHSKRENHENAEGYGYFIMAFFNEVPDFSNPITLYDNGAHLIFVKRKYKNKNEFISYNNEIEKTSDDFFNFYRGKQNKNKQFIFGVIIKG